MNGFTKLFSSILDSTVWREPDSMRILWIALLALADQDGNVYCSVPGLADRARISIEQCEAGLARFQQPDKYSASQEDDGRRIRVVDRGWQLINYGKYRHLMSLEERKEKARIRQQRHRDLAKSSRAPSRHVTPCNASNDIAEAEANTEAEAVKSVATPPDLHPNQYALKIIQELVMTENRQHMDAVSGAFNLELNQGKSKRAAYEFILAIAMDAKDAGVLVDFFYFRDWGKHRNGVHAKPLNAMDAFKRKHLEAKA